VIPRLLPIVQWQATASSSPIMDILTNPSQVLHQVPFARSRTEMKVQVEVVAML